METKRVRPRARRSWCARCVRALPQFGKDLEQYKHPGWEDVHQPPMLKDILKKLEDRDTDSPSKDEIDGDSSSSRTAREGEPRVCREGWEIESTLDTVLAVRTARRRRHRQGTPPVRRPRRRYHRRRRRDAVNEQAFYDAYRLGRLQTFVWINAKGFQKIMKKYATESAARYRA